MIRRQSNKSRSGSREAASRHDGSSVRERIIDCATDLLGREGYGAMSVSAICRLAEVSAPTLYWHFGNKEGLLAAVLKSSLRRDADTFKAIEITQLSRTEAFERYLEALRRIIVSEVPNNWVILSSLSEARHAAPEIVDIIAEARRRQIEFNAEYLRTIWGLRNNQLFVHLWIGYCNYLALLYQDTKDLDLVEQGLASFRSLYHLLLAALGEDVAHEAGFDELLIRAGYRPIAVAGGPLPPHRGKSPKRKSKRNDT